jgi:hypothetical protein
MDAKEIGRRKFKTFTAEIAEYAERIKFQNSATSAFSAIKTFCDLCARCGYSFFSSEQTVATINQPSIDHASLFGQSVDFRRL